MDDGPVPRPAISGYPVSLVVAGRRCVVVGAGRVAARKVDALLVANAEVHVVAPEVSAPIRSWSDEGRLTLAEREFEAADLDGAWLKSWDRSTRHCWTCCRTLGKRCGPKGVPPRNPIGSRPSIPACST